MKQAYFLFLLFAVFILAVLTMTFQNISELLGNNAPSLKVIVYIKESASASERQNLVADLKAAVSGADFNVQSPQDQLADLQDVFSSENQGSVDLEDIQKSLPESYSLVFPDLTSKAEFLKKFSNRTEVDSIITGDNWRHQFAQIERSITAFSQAALLFFFLFIAFITALTTRLSLLEEQKSIEIFSLLGISPKVIYQKYFIKFILISVSAMVLGLTLSFVFFRLIQYRLHAYKNLSFIADRISFLDWGSSTALALGLLFAFVLSGYFTTKYMIQRVYFRGDI